MSTAELRQAAETLRREAQNVMSRAPWTLEEPDGRLIDADGYGVTMYDGDATYLALVQPNIGLVLADWLDQCADRLDKGHHTGSRHSHRIARLINGGAS